LRALPFLRIAALTTVGLACFGARAEAPKPPAAVAPLVEPANAQSAPPADSAPPDSAAEAPRPTDAEVDRHAAVGQRLLERGRTQDAIAEFRRAYELRADPRFLYDIAGAYRQLGARDQARFFYERYLAAAPDAPDREEVEAALAALGGRPAPRPSFARDVVIVPVTPAPEAPRPLWRRWWVWTAFGALVAAGIATALLTQQADTQVPATALGDKRFY
jgi:tetratricopeptide (TPR) repeat protein